MRRRDLLITGASIGALSPLLAIAQKTEVRLVGLLSPFTREETEPWHEAFRQGLRGLGWIEGSNIRFEYRYSDGNSERLPEIIADLLKQKPEVVLVCVNSDALPAAKATKTVPIVMASGGDPVATGLVKSLARPGGNVTGLTQIDTDLAAKRLQLLKDAASGISRVAVLWDPRVVISSRGWQEIQEPARKLEVALQSLEVRSEADLDLGLARAVAAGADALLALPGPLSVVNQKRIAEFALKHRLPSIFHLPEFVGSGGLMSYGPDRADLFRRAAGYVDKILKGANPGDLPVEQPTKFQLVVNLKTAKTLGLTISQALVARADEVIE